MPRTTYAIGAHELRDHHILVGDHISPTRFGAGAKITVNDDIEDTVLVLAGTRHVEYLPTETVYILR